MLLAQRPPERTTYGSSVCVTPAVWQLTVYKAGRVLTYLVAALPYLHLQSTIAQLVHRPEPKLDSETLSLLQATSTATDQRVWSQSVAQWRAHVHNLLHTQRRSVYTLCIA